MATPRTTAASRSSTSTPSPMPTPIPYWYEDADEPDSNPTLVRTETCDLCIIGGGYTGLWTALIAKERDPSRDVVLIDAHEIGSAASGRNGGFMESSLTHGVANGQERFPDEIALLEELGLKNLNDIESAITALRHRLRLRAHRRDRRGHHVPLAVVPRRAARRLPAAAQPRPEGRVARRAGDAAPGQLAHLHRRAVAQGPRGDRRPGAAGVGAEGRGDVAGRAHLRRHQGDVDREGRRRRAGQHAARPRARRQGGARPPTRSSHC